MSAEIRKTAVIVEETLRDVGRAVDPPTRKAAALAVIAKRAPGAMSRT